MFKLKRAYERASPDDGFRVLVERLWPRGVTREELAVDLWLKDVAPSTELRKWFGHDPQRWGEFRKKYRAELDRQPKAVDLLLAKAKEEPAVTLVYAAKDEEHSGALVLEEYLRTRRTRRRGDARLSGRRSGGRRVSEGDAGGVPARAKGHPSRGRPARPVVSRTARRRKSN
jgi:uncharacterized protein YeaO (DUF488 family)